jgi:TfoX/Sxy family transcriptional regulator of competence genes
VQMPKPTDEDRARFAALVPDQDARVAVKPMFGNLGAFVNGNMFMGLFGAAVGIKLDDAGREELAAVEGTGPFGPAERPMGGYVSLPACWVAGEEADEAHRWVQRSLDHVAALPPKPATSPGPRTSPKG